jgi:hypothetical protein
MRIDSPRGLAFLAPMRFVFLLFAVAASACATVPPALTTALETFRSDPPKGWSYTQTTAATGESMVERHDANRIEFERWSLVRKNDRNPTAEELKDYGEARSRRSRTGTAPKLVDQLRLETVETVADAAERTTYRCRLRPGEARDKTAEFLRATLVLNKTTGTIESVELSSVEAFSPTLGVKIQELHTLMTYSLPAGETPSLPQRVLTRVRGTAFWFKSLDAEMTVTYSDYAKAARK